MQTKHKVAASVSLTASMQTKHEVAVSASLK